MAKNVYFDGSRKKFRARYDLIVSSEPFGDGFGIIRDAHTPKPQAFRTGDGLWSCNLAVNLAQLQARDWESLHRAEFLSPGAGCGNSGPRTGSFPSARPGRDT